MTCFLSIFWKIGLTWVGIMLLTYSAFRVGEQIGRYLGLKWQIASYALYVIVTCVGVSLCLCLTGK